MVSNQGTLTIGDDLNLISSFAPSELAAGPGALLEIGSRVTINFGTSIVALRSIHIGSGVSFGPYCVVADAPAGASAHGDVPDAQPVVIEDDVWLAGRVTVLPGARIGAGSVVTAGSVVSGIIPARVVAGGSPARVLRKLMPASAGALEAAPSAPLLGGAASPLALERGDAAVSQLQTVGTPAPGASARRELRGVVIADFTADELGRALERTPDHPSLQCEIAPFGQVIPSLLELGRKPEDGRVDFAVIWTRPETALPSFQELAAFRTVPMEQLLREVDDFCGLVAESARGARFVFVPTWVVPTGNRGLGLMDLDGESGLGYALLQINLRLVHNLKDVPNTYVLNTSKWIEATGKNAFNPKLWYMGKMGFHPQVMEEAATDLHAAVSALTVGPRKLVVLDLDDTLWGGIVGDAGWQNLRLGGHDSLGESFADFQRQLKHLTHRGILLAIASKNDETVALEAIRSHPEMVLRLEDFAAWKISWRDKAQNIADLAAELNLGLQSVVFIDDNPVERARVREMLPEVYVPEWPEDKLQYVSALQSLRCFDAPTRSKEDAERTQMYATQRQREASRQEVGSVEDWLSTLGTVVRVEELNPSNLQRTVQLLNKTNQMNLSTRRLTEVELLEWVRQPGRKCWTYSVSDRFGDAGLTGILSMEQRGRSAHIVDFVLSCRVMGRMVEETLLHTAVDHARNAGLEQVTAQYQLTRKNKPCLELWKRSGWQHDPDTETFTWNPREPYALHPSIELRVSRLGE